MYKAFVGTRRMLILGLLILGAIIIVSCNGNAGSSSEQSSASAEAAAVEIAATEAASQGRIEENVAATVQAIAEPEQTRAMIRLLD